MSYAVSWFPDAEAALSRIRAASRLGQAVAEAAQRLDHELATQPLDVGESREHRDERVGFAWPIGIRFIVHDDRPVVIVLDVWLTE